MFFWLQIRRKKDISNNRKASTEPIIDEDCIAILQQTHANIQVLIAATTSTVFFLFNLSWQLARVFSNSEYWWNSISGLPLHRYLCFDFEGSSPPHRMPKSLTVRDPLQANRKSEHYSQQRDLCLSRHSNPPQKRGDYVENRAQCPYYCSSKIRGDKRY